MLTLGSHFCGNLGKADQERHQWDASLPSWPDMVPPSRSEMFAQSVGRKKKERTKEKKKQKGKKETNGVSNSHVAISHWFWPVWWLLPATSDAETGQCVQPVHDWSVLELFATNLLISALRMHLSLPVQQGYILPSEKNTGEKKKNPSNGKKNGTNGRCGNEKTVHPLKYQTGTDGVRFRLLWRESGGIEKKNDCHVYGKGNKKEGRKNYPTLCTAKRWRIKKRRKWFNRPQIVDRGCKLWRIGGCNVCRGFCWIA